MDSTSNKAGMRTHFNLKGFPCLLFWRKQVEPLDDLIGKTFARASDSTMFLNDFGTFLLHAFFFLLGWGGKVQKQVTEDSCR